MKDSDTCTALLDVIGENDQNRADAPLKFEIFIDRGEARDEDVQRIFDALKDLNTALGGKGITCQEIQDANDVSDARQTDDAQVSEEADPDEGGSL